MGAVVGTFPFESKVTASLLLVAILSIDAVADKSFTNWLSRKAALFFKLPWREPG